MVAEEAVVPQPLAPTALAEEAGQAAQEPQAASPDQQLAAVAAVAAAHSVAHREPLLAAAEQEPRAQSEAMALSTLEAVAAELEMQAQPADQAAQVS